MSTTAQVRCLQACRGTRVEILRCRPQGEDSDLIRPNHIRPIRIAARQVALRHSDLCWLCISGGVLLLHVQQHPKHSGLIRACPADIDSRRPGLSRPSRLPRHGRRAAQACGNAVSSLSRSPGQDRRDIAAGHQISFSTMSYSRPLDDPERHRTWAPAGFSCSTSRRDAPMRVAPLFSIASCGRTSPVNRAHTGRMGSDLAPCLDLRLPRDRRRVVRARPRGRLRRGAAGVRRPHRPLPSGEMAKPCGCKAQTSSSGIESNCNRHRPNLPMIFAEMSVLRSCASAAFTPLAEK
jgi:hypothetical protein